MIVFVDYENLPLRLRHSSIDSILDVLVEKLTRNADDQYDVLSFRLYSGWYSSNNMTRQAQSLSVIIQNCHYPVYANVRDANNVKYTTKVDCVLAKEVLINKRTITNTLRQNRCVGEDVYYDDPINMHCTHADCQLPNAVLLLNRDFCAHDKCQKKPKDLIRQNSQKMVDAMIIVDIATLVFGEYERFALVSSDSDFLPAVLLAVSQGVKVVHILEQSEIAMASNVVGSTSKHVLITI